MKQQINSFIFSVLAIMMVLGVAFFVPGSINKTENGDNIAYAATVYKSPTCECCDEYIEYLKANGVDVTVEITDDMAAVKENNQIPESMTSCHTTVMNDYFFEGHIPFDVMTQMMSEHMDIDGIALPGMPAGSPGMPGEKIEMFEIHKLVHGEASPYINY